jgi:signal peptidase I
MVKKVLGVLYILLIFLVGFVVGQFWDSFSNGRTTGLAVNLPSDFVSDNKISVYDDKVVIEIVGAQISTYESTGSMLPTLGAGMNGISVVPSSPDEINVGDIVSFRRGDKLIVHRVIGKGNDAEGLYFVTKGDNSPSDDGKIRFGDIERVLIGLIF